jgi:hypothetical protein
MSLKEKCSFIFLFFYLLRITTNFIIVVLHWHNTIGKYRWYWIIGYTKFESYKHYLPFCWILTFFFWLSSWKHKRLQWILDCNTCKVLLIHANNTSSIPSTFSIHINKNWYTIWNVLSYTRSSIRTIIYIWQCVSSLWYRNPSSNFRAN